LVEIDELGCLLYTNNNLTIIQNNNLENLNGLASLFNVGGGYGHVNISNNPKLPTAKAMALIVQLQNNGWDGTWTVSGNLN
jgi:hypothetical protein